MFYHIINKIKHDYRQAIMSQPRFINTWLSEFSQSELRHSLHKKEINYITSLFKKAARNSKKCLMLLSNHWIDDVAHGSVRI
jgi:glutaredoxin 2